MITENIARKVLTVVDAGLVKGVGQPIPGKMCVEAAVCYAMDLPHGDDPVCVPRALRSLKIKLNDSRWSSDQARAKGLRRLAVIQLGSQDVLDEKEFARRCAELAISACVPTALRAAASIQKNEKHKTALYEAANKCEKEKTRESALEAKKIAYAVADAAAYAAYAAAAHAAAYAADAAAYAADAAAYAADAAAYDAAADAAADVAAYAADAAAYDAAADAADAAADAAADVAAYAADAAAYDAAADAADAAADKVLSDFAEGVVQILISMNVPGAQWLFLTED